MQQRREVSSRFFFSFSRLPKNLHTPTFTYIMYNTHTIYSPETKSGHAFTHNTRSYKLKHTHATQSLVESHTFRSRHIYSLSVAHCLQHSHTEIEEKKKKKNTKKKHPPRIVCPASGRWKWQKGRFLAPSRLLVLCVFSPPSKCQRVQHVTKKKCGCTNAMSRITFSECSTITSTPRFRIQQTCCTADQITTAATNYKYKTVHRGERKTAQALISCTSLCISKTPSRIVSPQKFPQTLQVLPQTTTTFQQPANALRRAGNQVVPRKKKKVFQ